MLYEELFAIVNLQIVVQLPWVVWPLTASVKLALLLRRSSHQGVHIFLCRSCTLVQVVEHLFVRLLLALRFGACNRLLLSNRLLFLSEDHITRVLLAQTTSLSEGSGPRLGRVAHFERAVV